MRTTGLTNAGAITDWDECKREAKKVWPDADVYFCVNGADHYPLGCYLQEGKIYFNDVAKPDNNNGQCSKGQTCLSILGGKNQMLHDTIICDVMTHTHAL